MMTGSIYKHAQRDETNFFEWLLGLFGARCHSYYQERRHECTLPLGHSGRHFDYRTGLHWGYGDDAF